MKVYTKTGDKGTTSLISGRRVQKHHQRIDAYGTIDELMAFTAVLYDQINDKNYKSVIISIQDCLMVSAAILAADCDDCEVKLPEIREKDIALLEDNIDEMEKDLPPLMSFILPGGHTTVSFCHVARTICRRAERLVNKVNEEEGQCDMVLKYLNRLSDYFFVLSRKLAKDLKVEEIVWNSRS